MILIGMVPRLARSSPASRAGAGGAALAMFARSRGRVQTLSRVDFHDHRKW